MIKALDAGIDQFGGEAIPDTLVGLVRTGAVSEARIDESARRLLLEKFTLGLFDDPFVDAERAELVVGATESREAGLDAQAAAHTLLVNSESIAHLPLRRGVSVYVEGMDPITLAGRANVVATPEEAEIAILRVAAPFEQRGHPGDLESFFHAGSLDFPAEDVEHIREIAEIVPTVIGVYLDRGAVLTPLLPYASSLIAEFGASDEAFARVIFGEAEPLGQLPIELPSSMAAVRAGRPDVPSDSKDPTFGFGSGLRYENWQRLPHPTREEQAATKLARRSWGRYRLHRTSIGLLLKDPDARAILTEDLPELLEHPMLNISLGMDVRSVLTMISDSDSISENRRERLLARLSEI